MNQQTSMTYSKNFNINQLVDTINKGTNSVNQMRNVMFLPYQQIDKTLIYKEFIKNDNKAILLENKYFTLKIRNRLLSQIHRDILDIIFSQGILNPIEKQAYVEFSMYDLLKRMGRPYSGRKGKQNYEWTKEKLKELQDVSIELKINYGHEKGHETIFGMVDRADYSEKRKKFIVLFSRTYLQMFQKDILVDYNYYLPQIINIKNDTVKAFVRYIISNDYINDSIENILTQLEIKKEHFKSNGYWKIKNIIKNNIKTLNNFGININNSEQVYYKKLEKIVFYNIKKSCK